MKAKSFQAAAMLQLETIVRRPATPRPNAPRLLLVHGICVGAWVWEEHFMPYLADAGFEVHALSLRGHGNSDGAERLNDWRLGDYTEDLRRTVAQLRGSGDAPLVVVGHSLGGAVVQDWLRGGGHAAGAALLASVPPWGLAYSAWQMWLNSPELFQQVARLSDAQMLDPAVMRRHLFSDDLPDAEYARFAGRVQGESRHVGVELQGWRPFAPMPWQAPPMFVLGGLDDRFIRADAVQGTATYYGVAPVLVPRLAHALMLDPRWEDAARPLRDWLVRMGE
ncbi:alpha/beta hydrolase [uncultured Massilia sp.]|uniref:alpha/beta hydrolase n=1 Tax=uncultured Massilia sp. TaxID=169973 RepID=UPI0025EF9114|nr:alpha/beta fold hydrolase [uncultured Massilia sp.]